METIKDRASFVSGHLHGDPFGNPCSYHIAHRGAPEIADDLTWKTSLLASPTPTLVIVYNPMTMVIAGLLTFQLSSQRCLAQADGLHHLAPG